jgi:hypothetical protein
MESPQVNKDHQANLSIGNENEAKSIGGFGKMKTVLSAGIN